MSNKGKILFSVLICLCFSNVLFSQENKQKNEVKLTAIQKELKIQKDDVKLVPDKENGGYHLYIRKLPKVESVLLTETTKDPNGKADSYTFRAKDYNPINGDEMRLLDGKPLVSEGAKYSLVDSSVENTSFFGPAFHIFIPSTIYYGYPWTRNGSTQIKKGTFINIRSFDKPYADYTGNYMDSPFMFDFIKKTKPLVPTMTADYNPLAGKAFQEISEDVIYSMGPETIIDDILKVLEDGNIKKDADIVFAIDATGSMKNDIEKLKECLLDALNDYFGKNSNTRLGLLFYRDYGDSFKYMDLPVKVFGFTDNFTSFSNNLKSIKIYGWEGGDIPEAVYEAMYAACSFYNWRNDSTKQIILIGDAEPHPVPRGSGKYSKEYVTELAKVKGIKIKSILLPED